MDDGTVYSPSLKNKLKESICFSCCFRRHRPKHHQHHPLQSPSQTSFASDGNPTVIWVKMKRPRDLSFSDVTGKCRSMLGIGRTKHKRYSSADFRYDPLSYALNFEDGFDDDDEAPLRNFTARLPVSPPDKPPPSQIPAVMRVI